MLVRLIYLSMAILYLQAPAVLADSHGEIEEVSADGSSMESYNGPWEFGLGFEFTNLEEFDTGDLSWALIIGKDTYRNSDITMGVQLHFSSSFSHDVSFEDEVSKDSTNIFLTSHFNGFSALKFKLGLSYTRLDTFFGRETDTGMIYGVDLALPEGGKFHHTLLSFEDSISGPEYQTLFINLIILLH